MRLAWLLLLVGCGRLGFETSRDGALGDDDGGAGGDALVDGPPNTDAMDQMTTFGENPNSMVMGVNVDTFITQAGGIANNFGGADNIRIERDNNERGLIAFVVTQIPTTATVLSAKLRFFVEVATPSTITFHAVLEPWSEGINDGSAGFASYTFRQAGIGWSALGAGEPGSIGPALGTFSGGAMGGVDVPLPASLVQGWVTNPATNYGVLMESDSDSTVRLVSSEGTASQRPVLSVTYE